MQQLHKAVLFVLLFSFGLGACTPATPDPITVEIDMTEFAFSANQLEFEVGQEVTLILTNSGEKDHELMIGNAVKNEDGLPASFRFDFFRQGGVVPEVSGSGMLMSHEDAAEDSMNMTEDESMDMEDEHGMDMDEIVAGEGAMMVFIPVGNETTVVTFTVTEDMLGEWEMACFEESSAHYLAGMTGTVLVLP
jgi:plastocyanin